MNAGLGSPIMFVYAPLPYYIPALLRPLLPLSAVHNRESLELGFSVWLALLLSGFTAFAWLKKLASPLAASASAILYMLMPYHLSIDLYARDAVGEMWAFVWIPMALRFCADLLEGDSPVAGLGLSVSYALLIYSHLLIALLFTPVLVAMFLFLPRREPPFSAFRRGSVWLALGLGLAAAYWIPALNHSRNLSPDRMVQAHHELAYDFNFAFAWRALAGRTGDDLFLWKVSWVAASTSAVSAIGFLCARRMNHRASAFWLGVAAASLFMMLPLSGVIWKLLPPLAAIQFPWRFNTTLVLAATAIMAIGLDALAKSGNGRRAVFGAAGGCIVLIWIATDVKSVFGAGSWSPNMTLLFGDTWVPVWAQWANPALLNPQGFALLNQRPAISGNWSGEVSIQRWGARDLEFSTNVEREDWVSVRRLYYPGWTAETVSGRQLEVRPSPGTGLIDVRAPAGMSRIRLELPWNWAEKFGAAISGVLLIFTAVLWLTKTTARQPSLR
jgi:hypothetical protein